MADDRNNQKNQSSREPRNEEQGSGNSKPEQGRKKRIQPRVAKRNNYNAMPTTSVSRVEKVETVVQTSTRSGYEYGQGVLSLVESLSGEQPNERYSEVNCMVIPSSLFDYFIESVHRYVEIKSMRPSALITLEDLDITFRYILAMRIAQVSGYRMPQRPAEVRYPSVLGPLLAAIGKYIHPTAAYEITPDFDPTDPKWEEILVSETYGKDDKGRDLVRVKEIVKPKQYDRVLSMLLALGLPENIGLPVDTLTETDELYRLEQNSDGQLTGSGDFAPSAGILLNRAFLELSLLARLYGHHRVVYASIDVLRSAVDKLARDSFTMEVGRNGL